MGQRTALYDLHQALGARMVEIDGWEMPLHYGSQVDDHLQVRQDCGLFDTSHMTIIDVCGADAREYLQHLLANDVARLHSNGEALYSAMLNEQGGVIDDLLVYWTYFGYRLVSSTADYEKSLHWMQRQAEGLHVCLRLRDDLSILSIQGPRARSRIAEQLSSHHTELIHSLAPFQGRFEGDWFIARTQYTGEDGLEIMLPAEDAVPLFNDLVGAGISPVGLGALETLRLEAGVNQYGQEIHERVTPLEANMDWSIAWLPSSRNFIGREALEAQRQQGPARKLVGLVLEERGQLRANQVVRICDDSQGKVTSGGFSPTLERPIALARVPVETGDRAEVEIRGKWLPVRVVKPAFVRQGKILV